MIINEAWYYFNFFSLIFFLIKKDILISDCVLDFDFILPHIYIFMKLIIPQLLSSLNIIYYNWFNCTK